MINVKTSTITEYLCFIGSLHKDVRRGTMGYWQLDNHR
jgi:hypothetical protein